MMNTLVLGLGNILLRDEGVGVRVAQCLQRGYEFPETVMILDGGTLGLELLPYVEEADRVIIIDAVKGGLTPGTVIRLCDNEIPAFLGNKVSPHQIGLQDLLALAQLRGHLPAQTVLWGIQAGPLEPGLELTPPVARQVETLVERVIEELDRWDINAIRREALLQPSV